MFAPGGSSEAASGAAAAAISTRRTLRNDFSFVEQTVLKEEWLARYSAAVI
jgi:hypothetical protein